MVKVLTRGKSLHKLSRSFPSWNSSQVVCDLTSLILNSFIPLYQIHSLFSIFILLSMFQVSKQTNHVDADEMMRKTVSNIYVFTQDTVNERRRRVKLNFQKGKEEWGQWSQVTWLTHRSSLFRQLTFDPLHCSIHCCGRKFCCRIELKETMNEESLRTRIGGSLFDCIFREQEIERKLQK